MGSGLGLAVSKISHPVLPSSKLGTHADSDAIESGEIHRLYECDPRGLRTFTGIGLQTNSLIKITPIDRQTTLSMWGRMLY